VKSSLIAVLAVGALALAGCGSTPAPGPGPAAEAASVAPAAPAPSYVTGAAPESISLPSIGATSSLVPVGLAPDGSMAVPSVHEPKQAAWFEPGPEPGQPGPAVVVGHIDGDHIPGVFFRLKDVREGDRVEVRTGGKTLAFTVYRTELVAKDAFPAGEVFGHTDGPELRLITCGGDFDHAARSYKGNTLVFAKLTA
jgi:sortase (surface protein transpeptidase)